MSTFRIWSDLPAVLIRQPPESTVPKASATTLTHSILLEIGENPIALDAEFMDTLKLKPLLKGFNPEEITPHELSQLGGQLYKCGLIDNHTAELMDKAGTEFDRDGLPMNPDVKINALDFFAGRISAMKDNSLRGDPYATMLLSDYIRAVHVMQNLHTYATTGDSYASQRAKEREQSAGGQSAG